MPDQAALAFANALRTLEPAVMAQLDAVEARAAAALDADLLRQLVRAFRDLPRLAPEYDFFAVHVGAGDGDGAGRAAAALASGPPEPGPSSPTAPPSLPPLASRPTPRTTSPPVCCPRAACRACRSFPRAARSNASASDRFG